MAEGRRQNGQKPVDLNNIPHQKVELAITTSEAAKSLLALPGRVILGYVNLNENVLQPKRFEIGVGQMHIILLLLIKHMRAIYNKETFSVFLEGSPKNDKWAEKMVHEEDPESKTMKLHLRLYTRSFSQEWSVTTVGFALAFQDLEKMARSLSSIYMHVRFPHENDRDAKEIVADIADILYNNATTIDVDNIDAVLASYDPDDMVKALEEQPRARLVKRIMKDQTHAIKDAILIKILNQTIDDCQQQN